MYTLYCRIYQFILRIGAYFMPWRQPLVYKGLGAIGKVPAILKENNIVKILIVTDKTIAEIDSMKNLLADLTVANIGYNVFDKTVANPTIDNIEDGFIAYRKGRCQGMIAFGGGSSMDCAKGIGARIARPHKTVTEMKGLLKVRRKLPFLLAIPTTAGTGSETTIAAVVVDSKTKEKYAINDPHLVPLVAVLDPLVTVGLPPAATAGTGMDVLCHAVEAYIGRSNTKATRADSIKAIELVFSNLENTFKDGSNPVFRERMLEASFLAGKAFTRAYVGNVHALAHPLSGFYGVPHGFANGVILPYVLRCYGDCVEDALSQLADVLGLGEGETRKEKALLFIKAVEDLAGKIGIPKTIEGILKKDIPLMANNAFHEANPFYPVPKIFKREDFICIYERISRDVNN